VTWSSCTTAAAEASVTLQSMPVVDTGTRRPTRVSQSASTRLGRRT
jgi:hypothetical protein